MKVPAPPNLGVPEPTTASLLPSWLRRLFTRGRDYRCGDCGERFKYPWHLDAHRDPACPIVVIERQIRDWNERHLRERIERQA